MNRFIVSALLLFTAVDSMAQGQKVQSAADQKLEQRIRNEFGHLPQKTAQVMGLGDGLQVLQKFNAVASAQVEKCVDAKRVTFNNKYILSYDSAGNPCRIYDLSFPTLETYINMAAIKLPVQETTSEDYLNWLDGNFSAIQAKSESFKKNFNAKKVAANSWISQLKFRRQPARVNGLPTTFRASDLDIGKSFQFDQETTAQLQQLIHQSQVYNFTSGSTEPLISDYWMQVLNTPQTFLEGVKFEWNDAEKVYDVVLEGGFLPVRGPIALVDYQVQYKYAIEKMVRSILASGLQKAARMIPEPFVANAVSILITDSFEQLEMAYEYQMNQLEGTLQAGVLNKVALGLTTTDAAKGLHILYGSRSDLLSAYIMSVAQGKSFDWSAMDRIGATARYNAEKQRKIIRANMNSKMVLETGCESVLMFDYFSQCVLNGKKDGIYSLISERVVWTHSFGAPLIYRFDRPYEVTLKRGGTWMLSIGLRMFDLPIPDFAVGQLDQVLKNYMLTGITDEAYLRNSLSMQNSTGPLMDWLFFQNLNPFLPKTQSFEQKVIEANLRSF